METLLKEVAEETAKIGLLAFFGGMAAFLTTPLIVREALTIFRAEAIGAAVTIPLILHILEVPTHSFNLEKYREERSLFGILIDVVLLLGAAFVPASLTVIMIMELWSLAPVPVAAAASVGVYTGYKALLYRNREFYVEEKIDIKL